ncbi:MAG: DUF4145 domain-containing protein [Candidatus Methanomethylophilaceae archaeon]|nr:DUF4145 domain-containing protein [Candidatus Methanomethylophilaceae archaeon]
MKSRVTVKVPVVELSVSGEYSRFKKPTGLENMVLTAIGTPALRSDTWREFFARIGVPERMFPLFENVIEGLCRNEVIRMAGFSPDDRISSAEFTETGRDMFEQGRIKQEPKRFRETVFYTPYARAGDEPFLFAINVSDEGDFERDRFADVVYDEEGLRLFLVKNKKRLGADTEDEILTIALDDEPAVCCVDKEIYLQMDESSGDFYFESSMDPNFVKGHYDSRDLISSIEGLGSNPKNMILTPVQTVPEGWEAVRYDLPKDFSFRGKFIAYDRGLCTAVGATPVDGIGCAFADITSASIGRGYVLMSRMASVFGLKESVEVSELVSRPLSRQEIASVFDRALEAVHLSSYDQMMSFIEKAEVLGDPEYQLRVVRKHLDSVEDPTISLSKLSTTKAKWSKGLPETVEQYMLEMNKGVDTVVSMVVGSSLKLGCESLADKYRTGDVDRNIDVADKLFRISRFPGLVSARMGIGERIADMVLNGFHGGYISKEMQAAGMASANLSKLKGMFGVESLGKYDVSSFKESDTDSMMACYDALVKSMADVKPLVRGTEGDREIEGYIDLFQNFAEIYGKDVPLQRLNGYQFGIGVRRKAETVLRKLLGSNDNLAKLIGDAAEENLISDEEQRILDKIRNYGNTSAHTTNVDPIDSKEKKRWIRLVEDIENRDS